MAPRLGSSQRSALVNRTNIYAGKPLESSRANKKQEQEKKVVKRSSSAVDGRVKKRAKIVISEDEASDSCYDSDSDMDVDVFPMMDARLRKQTIFNVMHASTMGLPCRFRPSVTTRPILQSFVSSHKSDLYKCMSSDSDSYITPPYSCSYTNGAKRGEKPLLAVGTEEGSVHIIDTSKRKDWECERPRIVFRPHDNGIFDVKWNLPDNRLATSSGDHTTHISCPVTGSLLNILRGHAGTVKCVAWDPTHQDLLSTGGRDGTICIWDLRAAKKGKSNNDTIPNPSRPAMLIRDAHGTNPRPKGGQGKKTAPLAKSVTSLLYPESQPYQLVSSGSADGLLHCWDIRSPAPNQKASKTGKAKPIIPCLISPFDPTVLQNSRRPRGLTSLALGTGPTAGLIFALSTEARVHTYSLPDLVPQKNEYTNKKMKADSFYVKIASSPCGNWLASGSNDNASVFLFDVSNSARASWTLWPHDSEGVELRTQRERGEVGAVDWAEGALANCSDNGTVNIWRPDIDVYRDCAEAPLDQIGNWSWSTR